VSFAYSAAQGHCEPLRRFFVSNDVMRTMPRTANAAILVAATMLMVLCAFAQTAPTGEAGLARIQQLMQSGELDAAKKLIEGELRRGNRAATLYGFLGIIDAQHGEWQESEKNFEEAIRRNPEFEPPYLNLGRLYVEHAAEFQDAAKKAESAYMRLLARHPENAEAHYQLGRILEAERKYTEARASYEKALERTGATVPLLIDLARVSDRAGYKNAALGYLAHAREVEPENAAVHYAFGRICVDLDLPVEALSSFRRAVELKPEVADYDYAYGIALLTNRDAKLAAEEFEKFLSLKPGNALGVFSLARAQFDLDEMEEARTGFRLGVQAKETAAGSHYYLGRIAAGEGRLDEALQEYQASLKIYPEGVETLADLGSLYVEKREFDEARKTLTRALLLEPENYRANRSLLRLYQRTGDPQLAEQAKRMEELDKKRAERAKEVQRTIRVEPR
jgi:tetratricopeptide (TPR) repeat protein